jgi:acetolactate synthase-1/2/3 large subunit
VATVADLIVSRLRAAGVRAVFGVPGGGGNLDLVDAASRAGLPFVLTATETGAAIAAQVQADLTGGLGACLTTLGPGAASATNGVACAQLERAPLLIFTDRQTARRPAFLHQHLDQRALMGSITKRTDELTARTAGQIVDRAIRDALAGPPGPVHLDCPGAVLGQPLAARRASRRPARPPVPVPPRGLVRQARRRLERARRPLAIVGLAARRPADARWLDRICRRYGIPAMVTYKAKGVVPDDHPWFAGIFTNGAIEQSIARQADLILAIGLDPVELLPRPWPYRVPVISICPWALDRRHVPFTDRLVGEISAGLSTLEPGLSRSNWVRADLRSTVDANRAASDVPADGLTAQQVVRTTASAWAATHRLAIDAGAHMFPATMLWPSHAPHGVLISNGLATMGYAIPAAIGAAVTEPRVPVVACTGDGGLLMCAGELLTIVREKLRIVVIVFNDASLSLIEIKQQARRLPPAGVGLGLVDWAALARSLGLAGFIARTVPELERALSEAGEAGGPALIDARIDRSNYPATLRAIRGS